MKGRSKPSFVADALARGDINLVRAYGRRGGLEAAENRRRSAEAEEVIDDEDESHEQVIDDEDELYVQVTEDPTIVRKTRAVDQGQDNEGYYFGGHL